VVGACWAAGQIGKRPTQVNGCPQRIPLRDDLRDGRLVLVAGKKVSHDLLDRADRQPARQAQSLRATRGRTRSLRSARRSRTRVGT
jgi:hypothetical protein